MNFGPQTTKNENERGNGYFQQTTNGRFQFRFKSDFSLGVMPQIINKHFPQNQVKSPNRELLLKNTKTNWFETDRERQHIKYINFRPTAERKIPERVHLRQLPSPHFEDQLSGKQTYECANRETDKLTSLENIIGEKIRVRRQSAKRNHIPIASLGDKIYKYPEYEPEFYKQDCGLIPGSNIKTRSRYPFKISKKFHGE